MDRFLVLGATGGQGAAVARSLARAGHAVRAMSRSGGQVPATSQAEQAVIEPVAADLAEPDQVRKALDGVTHASVTLPLVYDADTVAAYLGTIIEAAEVAGLRKLVFNTGTRIPNEPTEIAAFETRRAAARAFLDSSIPTVVLRPPLYLDNLMAPWTLGPLLGDGALIQPVPAESPVAWLSHHDLGEVTVAALTRDELTGTFEIGGAEVVTGPELASGFASVLGRRVDYRPQPVDDFEGGLAMALAPATAAGVADTYRWAASGDGASVYDGDPAVVAETFAVRLTPLRSWIAASLAEAEVMRLHRVIERWLRGDSSSGEGFVDALHSDFTMAVPGGQVVGRDEVLAEFGSLHGAVPEVTVEIRDAELIEARDDLIVMTYEEWQHTPASQNARRSTVTFTDGLRWRHLHETWINPPS